MENSNHIWKIKPLRGPHFERCSLIPIQGKGERPDFLFRVSTEQGDGGPLLLTAELILHSDICLWEYADNHPHWKNDIRPLLLMLIQDIFWAVKIIECDEDGFKMNGSIADPKNGGALDFQLQANRFCEGDDTSLVLLTNYTNTHVIDQLKAICAQNPAVMWTEERAAEVKADFYRNFEEKQNRAVTQRLKRFSEWKRKEKKLLYFIDESGDLGFRDTSAYFLYIACGAEFSAATSMGTALREIINSEWGNTKPDELHFNSIPESKRAQVFSTVADCFEAHGGSAICYAMKKRELLKYFLRCEAETRRLENEPIITNLYNLFENRENNPGSYFLSLAVQEMSVLLGTQSMLQGYDFEIVHDRKHREWMNRSLCNGFERAKGDLNAIALDWFGGIVDVNSSFRLENSKDEPCLWISDWIGWEIGRWLRGEALSGAMKRALQSVRIITFDEYGQKVECDSLGGNVITKFPDWPRSWVPDSET